MRRRLIPQGAAVVLFALLAGCATYRDGDGETGTRFDPKYLFKTDVDRVVDTSHAQILEGLMRIADKLYRRNPREWKKAGFSDRDAAIARLRVFRTQPPDGLAGHLEGQAALRAFAPGYGGDRVGALLYGLLTMVDAAYEHRDESFILDSLDAQKFYNCARNMEVALWKLASSHDAERKPVLLTNEISDAGRNLSFEREFGRIVGLLDLMSSVLEDKHGRLVTRAAQSLATSFFLPVGGLH
ncbi:MAG: hypothetical protein LBO79_06015 [Zoogloeaceae bacterium]|jgi:hypothetical protein|nr:hypothetical protein [Zoogloeaceae bacterium]